MCTFLIFSFITYIQFYSIDDYHVILTGPKQMVMLGSTAKLTCYVTTKQHQPSWLKVRKSGKVCWDVKPQNISLPNGNEYVGIHIQIRNISYADAVNYTCEAIWERPSYSMEYTYRLQAACKSMTFTNYLNTNTSV